MNIGKYIRSSRENLRIRRADLAEMTGISLSFLYNIEKENSQTIKSINNLLTTLEELSMKNITIINEPAIIQTPWEALKAKGLNLDINKFVMAELVAAYYHKYESATLRYIDEYDSQYNLRREFVSQNVNELVIRHQIAVDFTLKLAMMAITYLEKAAEQQGIAPNEVKFNRIYLIEWDELLSQELHDYLEAKFSKSNKLPQKYLELIAKYMEPVETK